MKLCSQIPVAFGAEISLHLKASKLKKWLLANMQEFICCVLMHIMCLLDQSPSAFNEMPEQRALWHECG